ncbi:hypothetical protein D3C72_1319270 [compost metagenome]
MRETRQEPRQIALEVVSYEHRHSGGFLQDLLQRVQLLVVDLFPLRTAFYIGSAGSDLQTLLRLRRCVQRFDLRTLQVHEHLLFHVLVENARGRRQLYADHVHDWLFEIEPICGIDRDTHVA